ncbi:MAG TPA: hypothetical protein VMF14_00805 [Solirubrobacteraceae bacterium]|nr:hypothetical protein [Solirubrobacteraceae bacterium]
MVKREARGGWIRRVSAGTLVVAAVVAGGCGATTAAHTTTSAHSRGAPGTAVLTPLPAPIASRTARICRRAETAEDANVIMAWANSGARNIAPAVTRALGVAARHVATEARGVRGAAGPARGAHQLAGAMITEASVLRDTSQLMALRSSQVRLLSALHRRVAVAQALRVGACTGAHPVSALRPTAQAAG